MSRMDAYNELILDDDYKLRISSKRLKSGKYQVKFYATLRGKKKELYGYLLVNSDETLRTVIERIRTRLRSIDLGERLYLNNWSYESYIEPNFMIFQ